MTESQSTEAYFVVSRMVCSVSMAEVSPADGGTVVCSDAAIWSRSAQRFDRRNDGHRVSPVEQRVGVRGRREGKHEEMRWDVRRDVRRRVGVVQWRLHGPLRAGYIDINRQSNTC